MAMATILNLFNPSKAATLQSFMKFDERNEDFNGNGYLQGVRHAIVTTLPFSLPCK
jgi:hypothetical protein